MLRPQDVAVTKDSEDEEGKDNRNLISKGPRGWGRSAPSGQNTRKGEALGRSAPRGQNARKGEALGRLPLSLPEIFAPMLRPYNTAD